MQHKANFLNNSLFSLLLLGLLGITSCNTAMRLNVKKDDGNALAPQPRGVSIEFEEKKGPALGDTPDDNIEKIVELMKGEGTHVGTGSTALHYLALSDEVYSSSDYKQIVRLLVNQRADINVKDNGGWTPLHIAVSNKNDALVKALISNGADLAIKDESGWTPLHSAVYNRNYDLVQALIRNGVDLAIKDESNKTAYDIAEKNNDKQAMDLLYRDIDGRTKLHHVIMKVYPCLKEIKRLIALGVYVDAKDRNGNTPLHWASGNGHADVVKLLIDRGAKVGVRNGRGETPLSCVIRSCWRDIEKAKAIIEALIKAGADINAKNKDGNTALHWVSECGHADVVKLFIKAEADINAKNKDGDTALHRARENNHADVVELLIGKGAKVDVRNNQNQTLLAWAVDKGHTKVVNMLSGKDKKLTPVDKIGLMVEAFANSMHIQDEEKINREISRCRMTFCKRPY